MLQSTHCYIVDSRKARTVNAIVLKARASTARLEILVGSNAFVDHSLSGSDRARGPTSRANIDGTLFDGGGSGGADDIVEDTTGTANLVAIVTGKSTLAVSTTSCRTPWVTVGRDRGSTSTTLSDRTLNLRKKQVHQLIDADTQCVQDGAQCAGPLS